MDGLLKPMLTRLALAMSQTEFSRSQNSYYHEPRGVSLFDGAIATGSLTIVATGGALIGLGLRSGEPSRLFRLVGRIILERVGVASSSVPLTSVALGYLHHLLIAALWGFLFALLVLSFRGAVRVLAALAISVLYSAVSPSLLPPLLRIGGAVTNNVTTVVPIGGTIFLSLLCGMWLSSSRHRRKV